jgi:hypothetical protein
MKSTQLRLGKRYGFSKRNFDFAWRCDRSEATRIQQKLTPRVDEQADLVINLKMRKF